MIKPTFNQPPKRYPWLEMTHYMQQVPIFPLTLCVSHIGDFIERRFSELQIEYKINGEKKGQWVETGATCGSVFGSPGSQDFHRILCKNECIYAEHRYIQSNPNPVGSKSPQQKNAKPNDTPPCLHHQVLHTSGISHWTHWRMFFGVECEIGLSTIGVDPYLEENIRVREAN